jgi:hypothetical protein
MSKSEGAGADRPPAAEPEIVFTPADWRPTDALIRALADCLLALARKQSADLADRTRRAENTSGR